MFLTLEQNNSGGYYIEDAKYGIPINDYKWDRSGYIHYKSGEIQYFQTRDSKWIGWTDNTNILKIKNIEWVITILENRGFKTNPWVSLNW